MHYNGFDERVGLTTTLGGSPVEERRFVYATGHRIVGEYGATTADFRAEYIWLLPEVGDGSAFGGDDGLGGYMPLAVAVPDGATSKLHWVQGNHLGTPVVTTDASGAIVAPSGYARVGFPGQVEQHADLYYNHYRDYDPTLGRYVQADPIGLGGDVNPYVYAGSNPLVAVDPLGLAKFGIRPLGDGTEPVSDDTLSNGRWNLDRVHEQLWFDDDPTENYGFFPEDGYSATCHVPGRVRPDRGHLRSQFRFFDTVYDDDIMRKAFKNIKPLWDDKKYCLAFSNCQDFAGALRKEYNRVLKDHNDDIVRDRYKRFRGN